jgi:hypothetical protein
MTDGNAVNLMSLTNVDNVSIVEQFGDGIHNLPVGYRCWDQDMSDAIGPVGITARACSI